MGSTPEWATLLTVLTALRGSEDRPAIAALDGRSGAGKSTLAAALAEQVDAVVITGDDFYAGGTGATWDARTPAERAAFGIDWRRQRVVLETLARGEVAEWFPFNWNSPDWDATDQLLSEAAITCRPAPVVILEGAYSARPELHDLLDLTVLVDTPTELRRARLLEREGAAYRTEWEARWSSAEEHYFGLVMPPSAFDLVIGSGGAITISYDPDRDAQGPDHATRRRTPPAGLRPRG
jgi:uridine kinase